MTSAGGEGIGQDEGHLEVSYQSLMSTASCMIEIVPIPHAAPRSQSLPASSIVIGRNG